MNRTLILLALAWTAVGVAATDKQQVYKWTDASGVVHFTDLPPPKDTPNVQSVRMIGGGTTTAPSADKSKDLAPTTVSSTASTPANGQPDDATLCKQAHANLELLQGNTPVGIPGADGKAEALDDKAREGQIVNARLAITRFCK